MFQSMTAPPTVKQSQILDIPFANINLRQALDLVHQRCLCAHATNLFFINAHCLNTTFDDDAYRHALRRAELIFPDGSGVDRGCNMNGETLIENLNGTDLFPHLCQQFAREGVSIFLLGAEPGTADQVAEWATKNYPELEVAGTQDGYFSPEETEDVIKEINQSGAQVLFVAMGVPRQELWIDQHRHLLNTRLNIAVGGLFEFYAGNIPRAPLWMRREGVEWVWRLLQEPRRMWKRYLMGNPLFYWRLKAEQKARAFAARCQRRLGDQSQHRHLRLRSALQRLHWRQQQLLQRVVKRSIDLCLSMLGIVLLAPLALLIAAAIRLDSPGPVFFRQQRAGYRGRPFTMWKFRSMHVDAESRRAELSSQNEMAGGVLFKIRNDPRITRIGRWLRKTSLDELPQLWNVARGEMSLVGPRPALIDEVAQYDLHQRQRLDIKPGLTSDWVIAGRSSVPFERQAEMDIHYAHRHTLWHDLKLMLKTIPALLSGRGAC